MTRPGRYGKEDKLIQSRFWVEFIPASKPGPAPANFAQMLCHHPFVWESLACPGFCSNQQPACTYADIKVRIVAVQRLCRFDSLSELDTLQHPAIWY